MKNKIMNWIKENKWLLITLGVSSFIIYLVYSICKIAPFGDFSMLDVDFYHQYGPLLNELHDRVRQGESLLYSFNTGGGVPFYRNFLNYLSSPFNIILFLFKKEHIVMAFSIIIALKVIASSYTMGYYLKKVFKKDNFLLPIFSVLYSFSGYFCAYYWNIMWLDGMVFLPLIMYGIYKIIKENKPLFYIISLAVMLFANYFIGYMICIFSVLYFIGLLIYYYGFKIKIIFKKCLMFFVSSLLAGGLSAFALIPLFTSLSSISATKDAFPEIASEFAISDYIFNHFSGVNRTVFASDILPLPNVYCGLITLVGILLSFINNKISLKKKILFITVLLFFFLSFNINVLDFVWHAFHFPNDLPYRYSFIYVFSLINIGFYSFNNINSKRKFNISLCVMFLIVLMLIAAKVGFENLNETKIIILLILLDIYYVIYLLFSVKKIPRYILEIILIILVCIECSFSITINWKIDHEIDIFMKDKKGYQKLVSNIDDKDLYRIEKEDYKTLNDGAWYDYNGISTFSSMAYENTAKFQRKFGMSGNDINSYYYRETATPVYNTIFNVRYLMGYVVDNEMFSLKYSYDKYNLFKFDYPSSIAYAVDKKLENLKLEDYKPFLNQSNFVSLATNINDIYEPLKVSNVTNGYINEERFYDDSNGSFSYEIMPGLNYLEFELDNTREGNVYLYVGGANVENIKVDNELYSITSDEYYILDTGVKNNDCINVRINLNDNSTGNIDFYAYYINKEAFEEFYNKIKANLLNVTKYTDTKIIGNITSEENQMVFTTLSYDKGYKVYVDGKKIKTKKVLDTFLAFDITKGKHDIKIVYVPEKLTLGIIVSVSSLLILLGFLYKSKKKR